MIRRSPDRRKKRKNPEKVDEMAQWLASVSSEELRQMGHNGYDVIQRYYTKEKVTKQYVDLVSKIV